MLFVIITCLLLVIALRISADEATFKGSVYGNGTFSGPIVWEQPTATSIKTALSITLPLDSIMGVSDSSPTDPNYYKEIVLIQGMIEILETEQQPSSDPNNVELNPKRLRVKGFLGGHGVAYGGTGTTYSVFLGTTSITLEVLAGSVTAMIDTNPATLVNAGNSLTYTLGAGSSVITSVG